MTKYYQLMNQGETADLYIYGDITSWPWAESDVDAYSLVNELSALEGVNNINVYINSYGGEVAEGLAIYNALKRHTAKVTTICDGFACSIASVIFMAGDERVMNGSSLLMIHNPWTYTAGNAEELRKEADDLDKIAEASYSAYLDSVNIDRDQLKELLDAETWLTPAEALEMGFATIIKSDAKTNHASQSARKAIIERLLRQMTAETVAEPQCEEETSEPIETTEEEEPKQATIMELMSRYFNSKN